MLQLLQYPTSLTRVSLFKQTLLFLVLLLTPAILAESLFTGDKPVPPAVQLVEQQTELLLDELSNRKEEFSANPGELVRFAKTVALRHWDIPRTSRLILGPYWRTATTQDRDAFSDEFLRTLLRYVVRAYGYYDEDLIKVVQYDWQAVKRGGWVLSKVQIPGGLKVDVDYRMSYNEDQKSWHLIDIRVEGISLVKVKRSEFRQVIAKHGIQDLIQKMANKNNEVLSSILVDESLSD